MARAYGCVIDSEYQPALSDNTPSFPWPPRNDESFIDALATTWRASVFSPKDFFRRMPREFDFGWVIGYYLIVGVVAEGIGLFWDMVFDSPSLMERYLPPGMAPATSSVVDFFLSPLWLLLGLFIIGGIIHLFLLLVRGANHGYTTTLRVFCFATSAQLFAVVPFIGAALGAIWGLVITIIGLREAHDTSTGKAVAALLIPMLMFSVLAVLMMLATVATGLLPATR